MKTLKFTLFTVLLAVMNCSVALAQDVSSSSTSTTTQTKSTIKPSSDWMNSPWVWIVAGAVFLLILVAVISSGRRRSADASTTQRTTVTRTDEVSSD